MKKPIYYAPHHPKTRAIYPRSNWCIKCQDMPTSLHSKRHKVIPITEAILKGLVIVDSSMPASITVNGVPCLRGFWTRPQALKKLVCAKRIFSPDAILNDPFRDSICALKGAMLVAQRELEENHKYMDKNQYDYIIAFKREISKLEYETFI